MCVNFDSLTLRNFILEKLAEATEIKSCGILNILNALVNFVNRNETVSIRLCLN